MPASADRPARHRIVEAAAQLFRSRGYEAASLRDIVKAAGAPRGSLQHYFPGGKPQLALEAIDLGRAQVGEAIDGSFAATRSPQGALRRFFERSITMLEEQHFAAGCPVATVALERSAFDPAIRDASTAAFADWIDRFAGGLHAGGIEPRAARRLATQVLSQYEGALLLARAGRSGDPMRAASTAVQQLAAAAAGP